MGFMARHCSSHAFSQLLLGLALGGLAMAQPAPAEPATNAPPEDARAAEASAEAPMPDTLPDDRSAPAGASPATQSSATEDDSPLIEPQDAQSPSALRFEAQLAGVLAFPWKGDNGTPAYGFALTYGIGWGSIPLLLGIDFMSADSMGSSSAQIDVTTNGQALSATQTSRARQLFFDAWLRVQPPRWSVRPYVEGFVGTKLFQTRYSLQFDAQPSGMIDDHAWAGSLGWGAGVDFLGLLNAAGTLTLSLGVRSLSGAHARLNRVSQVDGQVVTVNQSVATDAMIFMLGISGRYDMAAGDESVQ